MVSTQMIGLGKIREENDQHPMARAREKRDAQSSQYSSEPEDPDAQTSGTENEEAVLTVGTARRGLSFIVDAK